MDSKVYRISQYISLKTLNEVSVSSQLRLHTNTDNILIGNAVSFFTDNYLLNNVGTKTVSSISS